MHVTLGTSLVNFTFVPKDEFFDSRNSPQRKLTQLFMAIEREDVGLVRHLLDKDRFAKPIPINSIKIHHFSVLHFAAQKGNCEIIDILLRAGAQVNNTDIYDNIPLHYASSKGHVGAANRLIDAGSQCEKKNILGKRPLHFAVSSGKIYMVKNLIGHHVELTCFDFTGVTPLTFAMQCNELKIAAYIKDTIMKNLLNRYSPFCLNTITHYKY